MERGQFRISRDPQGWLSCEKTVVDAERLIQLDGEEASGNEEPTQGVTSDSVSFEWPELNNNRLGKYEITTVLGVGGMGIVLEGYDPDIDRKVAIKLLHPAQLRNETVVQRFINETHAIGRLNHPNVVAIYEVTFKPPLHYYVMEYLEGGNVSQRIGDLTVTEATRMLMDACHGVAAVHDIGLIHRDIKPGNLLLTRSGRVKIADFGLVKGLASEVTGDHIVGTPQYMSPEQCSLGEIGHHTDIYALGATYYTMLTGHSPYSKSSTPVQMMYAHVHGPVPDPCEGISCASGTCERIRHIVRKAMAKKPADRYQSVDQMLVDLQQVADALGVDDEAPSSLNVPPGANLQRPRADSTTDGRSARSLSHFQFQSVPLGWLISLAALLGLVSSLALWSLGLLDGRGGLPSHSRQVAEKVPPLLGLDGQPLPPKSAIEIGVLHSLSGTMAGSEAPLVDAIRLAVEQINAQGGILGHPVEPIVANGRSDPQQFAQQAEELLRERKVAAVFGGWTTESRRAMVPVVEQHDGLLFFAAPDEGLEESEHVISLGATPNQHIVPALRWAYAFQDKHRFYLVGSESAYSRVAHAVITDTIEHLGGEVAGETFLPLGTQQVGSAIEAINEAQPDLILNTIQGDTDVAFFRAARAEAVTEIPVLSFTIGEDSLHKIGEHLQGDWLAGTSFVDFDAPQRHALIDRVRDRYGPQRTMTPSMKAAYISVQLWAQAVRQTANLQPNEVRSLLLSENVSVLDIPIYIQQDFGRCFQTPWVGKINAEGQVELVWIDTKPLRPRAFEPTQDSQQWDGLLKELFEQSRHPSSLKSPGVRAAFRR